MVSGFKNCLLFKFPLFKSILRKAQYPFEEAIIPSPPRKILLSGLFEGKSGPKISKSPSVANCRLSFFPENLGSRVSFLAKLYFKPLIPSGPVNLVEINLSKLLPVALSATKPKIVVFVP